ncbi:MAG: FHA domain-containing protein [Planctomycetota bacterium]|nr:MAG: FHA domain-containing protein [Planctomycetota bacterium]
MGTILIVAGRDRGSYYPLSAPTTVIGRDESCEIQIVDEMISRRHTQISCREEQDVKRFFITDMQSANGVFVNGRQVSEETELNDGDTIKIGESKLFFSTKRFRDLDTAMTYFKQRGQQDKGTIVR